MPKIRTFTPSSLSEALAKCEITAAEIKKVRVHGIFEGKKASQKDQDKGIFRGKLRDIQTKRILNVKLKESEDLNNFDECVLEGELEHWIPGYEGDEIKISLYFGVSKIICKGPYKLDAEEIKLLNRKLELADLSQNRKMKNVTSDLITLLENNQKPKIALIEGKSTIVSDDVDALMRGVQNHYILKSYPVNLFDPEEIINNLNEVDRKKYDLVCLYRGGGDGLNIFNDIEIAECVANLNTTFVTSIGHARDYPFIQVLADRVFETPSAFGTYLNKCRRDAYSISKRMQESRETENKLNQKLEELNNRNSSLQKNYERFFDNFNQNSEISKKNTENQYHSITNLLGEILKTLKSSKRDVIKSDDFSKAENKNLETSKQNTFRRKMPPESFYLLIIFFMLGITMGVVGTIYLPNIVYDQIYSNYNQPPANEKSPNAATNVSNYNQNTNTETKENRQNRRKN